jgi:hypothetical protein
MNFLKCSIEYFDKVFNSDKSELFITKKISLKVGSFVKIKSKNKSVIKQIVYIFNGVDLDINSDCVGLLLK